ncbi:type II secretion system GspH family protein [Shewanella abyssi]|uniref:type II secretion system protein n=1 Tax=Shewanella abyssi TaxID=311789 RepID=UPI0020102B75|nr:type II secretion system protein [Shewanella abyssi]MCL1052217.1 type II secretion system GspH family protein [Shewanella abyssi]
MKSGSKGFTLIELVVVIIILGLISIVAAPRFVSLNQDAHDAAIHNVFGSFTTAVGLYHSCWLASGSSGYETNLRCYGAGDLDSTATGFPLGLETAQSENGTVLQGDYCKQVWEGLLDNDEYNLAWHENAAFSSDNDIVYWFSSTDLSEPSTHCYFNYIADNPSQGAENWQLKYYPGSGKTLIERSVLSIQ